MMDGSWVFQFMKYLETLTPAKLFAESQDTVKEDNLRFLEVKPYEPEVFDDDSFARE
jgi:hypothetical protein